MRKFFLLSFSFFLVLGIAFQPSLVTANASGKLIESKPPESEKFQSPPFAIEAPESPPHPELPGDIRLQPFGNTDPAEQRVNIPPTEEHIAQTKIQVDPFDCDTVSDVTYDDCSGLLAVYYANNGVGWLNNTNWLVSTTIDSWYGVTVSGGRVTELNLRSNQLSGPMSIAIGGLSELTNLNVSNNQLSGVSLWSLHWLTKLTRLDLSNNQLTGEIPTVLGDLTSLKGLNLSGNQLWGSIPASLGNLTLLEYLQLNNNQLTGSIPLELGNLKKLLYLYLEHNQLSGNIPSQLGSLPAIQDFILNDNHLSGEIPSSLGSLTTLKGLWLFSNQLSGPIPTELGNLANMFSLKLNNNSLEGEVPIGITDLPQLCGADNTVYPCSSVHNLDLGYNQLSVPASVPGVAAFLTGKDPDWVLTQAVKKTITATGGSLLSNDGKTEIVIPAGALTGDSVFLFTPQPSPSQSVGGLNFAGNSFQLTAWTGEPPTPLTNFEPPLVVTLHYDEADLGACAEVSLKLYYWDSLSANWLDAASTCPGGAYTRNLVENWLSLPICHLSEFALMSMPGFDLFMPLIKR